MKLSDWILNLLFPPKCPFCGRILEDVGVCSSCEPDLPWLDDSEGLRQEDGFRCAGAMEYDDAVRDALLRLKFSGCGYIAEPMGLLIARCVTEHFDGEFDVVTWVPVSRKRLRKRGYDQAKLMAEAVCRQFGRKPVCLLKKKIHNQPQSKMQGIEVRHANVRGVYEATDAAAGKRILLVDDICTTGATLKECTRVLKDAGAVDVVCATAAMGIRKKATQQSCNP